MYFKEILIFVALSMVIGFVGCAKEKVEAPKQERITKNLIPPKAEINGANFLIEISELQVITIEDKASKEIVDTPNLRGRIKITNKSKVTLMAPSKTFNLAGLKFSLTINQNPELRQRFLSAGSGLGGWANLISLTAAGAAYQHGGEWLEQLMVYLEGNRDYLFDFVRRELPGVTMAKPEATYLAWMDCRGMSVDGSPCEHFLQVGRVALGDGREIGPGGEGFVRLNFGCPRALLEEGLAGG